MEYIEEDIKNFLDDIWEESFSNNNGGMGAPDLFSLYFALNKIKPKIVVESGVWNGVSTKLIRKVLPESIIICLDPQEVPQKGYKDKNMNTMYHLGSKFIDFKNLDLHMYDSKDIFCFFDDHQNAYLRTLQCIEKNIQHVFFNDNYPVQCGSHFTIQHLMQKDNRHFSVNEIDKNKLLDAIDIYHIFHNVYPGNIKTGEGMFECRSYFTTVENDCNYEIFNQERHKYRWNTYIKLKPVV